MVVNENGKKNGKKVSEKKVNEKNNICAECGVILDGQGVVRRGDKRYCSVNCALKKKLNVGNNVGNNVGLMVSKVGCE